MKNFPWILYLVTVLSAQPLWADLDADLQDAFQKAVESVAPSVVMIETAGGVDKVGKVLKGQGPTTGVVISPEGYIATSAFNFVHKPSSILVTLKDDKRYPAKLVASDLTRQITVLKIDAKLQTSPAAPLSELKVGHWSLALGRTWGGELPAMSVGIISALHRVWGKAVQTDAKVSPANYGGPLIDINGRIIGVLVPLSPMKEGKTAGYEWYDSGIGFAVPIGDITRALPRLKEGKDLKRGLIGVGLDRNLYKKNFAVTHIFYKSPAAEAGIKKKDRILEFDGKPIKNQVDLRYALASKYAGDIVKLKVARGKEEFTKEIMLIDELLPQERPMLGILPSRKKRDKGVEVRAVLPGSLAAELKIQAGDVISKLEKTVLKNRQQLLQLIARSQPGEKISLELTRGEEKLTVEGNLSVLNLTVPQNLEPETHELINFKPPAGVGVITKTIAKQKKTYHAYVPHNYEPEFPMGLVVILDTVQGDIQEAWKAQCRARNIALLGLQSSSKSWKRTDINFIQVAVADFRKAYKVDSARIVIQGHGPAASIAFKELFRQRNVYRGIIASGFLRKPVVADFNARFPASILIVADKSNTRPNKAIRDTMHELKEKRYSTILWSAESIDKYLPPSLVERAAQWLDSLDRL